MDYSLCFCFTAREACDRMEYMNENENIVAEFIKRNLILTFILYVRSTTQLSVPYMTMLSAKRFFIVIVFSVYCRFLQRTSKDSVPGAVTASQNKSLVKSIPFFVRSAEDWILKVHGTPKLRSEWTKEWTLCFRGSFL